VNIELEIILKEAVVAEFEICLVVLETLTDRHDLTILHSFNALRAKDA
jgi:hypothetical protein